MKELAKSFANSILQSQYPILGLILTAFAESSFFPFPPDLIYIPLALMNPEKAFFYAGITTFFSVLGGVFGYYIGKFGGKKIVNKLINDEKLYQVKLFYNKYDVWAIIIAGFTPIPYKVFSLSAGLFDLNLKKFILSSIIGRGGRFFLVCSLIYFFGPNIKIFLEKYFELATLGLVILLIGGFLFIKFFFSKK